MGSLISSVFNCLQGGCFTVQPESCFLLAQVLEPQYGPWGLLACSIPWIPGERTSGPFEGQSQQFLSASCPEARLGRDPCPGQPSLPTCPATFPYTVNKPGTKVHPLGRKQQLSALSWKASAPTRLCEMGHFPFSEPQFPLL